MRRTQLHRTLQLIRHRLRARRRRDTRDDAPQGWPPGHFYSPVVSTADIQRHRHRVYASEHDATLPGVALDLAAQLGALERIASGVTAHPWGDRPHGRWRYGFDNPNFGPGESLVLLGMLREITPRRLIEVGAGWSTRAILDVNDLALGGNLEVTTVEPYASRVVPELISVDGLKIVESVVQELGVEPFLKLESGDVLFIDSSHVVKFGSDVQFLLNEVLPRLAPGVHVHFHDVMYPFEYPLAWIAQGRNWNETYALRGFLSFNAAFAIDLFASYVWALAPSRAAQLLPGAAASPGSSLWLHRI
jgi:Methyltransferase domain